MPSIDLNCDLGESFGTYTIGMASRELKDSEVEGGAKATVLALDGIAVVVRQR